MSDTFRSKHPRLADAVKFAVASGNYSVVMSLLEDELKEQAKQIEARFLEGEGGVQLIYGSRVIGEQGAASHWWTWGDREFAFPPALDVELGMKPYYNYRLIAVKEENHA